jgi:hypothetical protein
MMVEIADQFDRYSQQGIMGAYLMLFWMGATSLATLCCFPAT